jgi:hypothetical protein
MKIRNLKIAVSAASILACVFVLALWVRSHRVHDSFTWNGGRRLTIGSDHGQMRVLVGRAFTNEPLLRWESGMTMLPDDIGRWHFQASRQQILVAFPHRLPVTISILLAAAPWIHWRFSLRSVLIAITIAAIVLGLLFAF